MHRGSFYSCALLRRSPTPIGTAVRQQLRWIYDSIAAAPVAGARGDVFPLPTALSAEDEVLVTAAEKGDNKALKSKASREAGHRVWLHCIILVLNALPFSPQSFAKGKSGAAFAGISRPSERLPSGKMEGLRLLEDQVHKSRSSETMVPFLTQAAGRLCSWNQTPSFSGTRRTCMLASSCLNYHLHGEITLCPRGPFSGKVFDRDPPQRIHACLGVVPMGWLSATGIVQYLHRRLAQLSSAVPRSLEGQRDR